MKTFKITERASTENYQQTDWGGIYHNTPSEYTEPDTIEKLAQALQHYNASGKPVTIRNTGHSVNGQTLTDGVQISLKKLKRVAFDKEKMVVSCYAGNTWDEVLHGIGFPSYCLPIFPNNPGQKIQIGGTASVGGIGAYCTKVGGFWNQIVEITLVTMTGDILICNSLQNFQYLQYALSGFGRIGVIAEMKVKVVKSAQNISIPLLTAYNESDFLKIADDAFRLGYYDSVYGMKLFPNKHMPFSSAIPSYVTLLIKELSNDVTADDVTLFTKEHLHRHLYLSIGREKTPIHPHDLDFAFGTKKISKRDLVYFYPEPKKEDQQHGLHPWNDYLIGRAQYPELMHEINNILRKYELEKYQIKDGLLNSAIDMPALMIYTGKVFNAQESPFPLSPAHGINDEYFMGIGINPTIPFSKLDDTMKASKEMTGVAYELGAKAYLYGFFDLTKKQIYQHFTEDTINTWNTIKERLDPKHLLNIGVLPHLD